MNSEDWYNIELKIDKRPHVVNQFFFYYIVLNLLIMDNAGIKSYVQLSPMLFWLIRTSPFLSNNKTLYSDVRKAPPRLERFHACSPIVNNENLM